MFRKQLHRLVLLFLVLAGFNAQAQVPSYSRTVLTGQTYTQISGGTTINTDAGLTNGSADDGNILVTLPFTFTYNGTAFTQATFNTNGWVGMGDQSAISAANSRAAGNLFTTTAPNNTLAAWFGDGSGNWGTIAAPGVGSMVHGTMGTGVYAFEWRNATGSGFSTSATNTINFMVRIYGPASSNPGRIELLYGAASTTPSVSRSIGIEDSTGGANHFLNALNNSPTLTTTASAWPGNGAGYQFDPPVPCTGAPNGGTVAQSIYNLCAGSTATLTVTGQTAASGLTYQWEQSTTSTGPWTNAVGGTGATTLSYTTPAYVANTPLYYRLTITCANSGLSSSSTVALVADQVAPATAATNITFNASGTTAGSGSLNWVNGNGNRRVVYINTTNSFVDPSSPTAPGTSATAYAGTGQQLVYDNTGTSVTITGLTPGTTYYARVYEAQRCSATEYYYNITPDVNNPNAFSIPLPPSNDECSTAIAVTPQPYSSPDSTCPSGVSGTTVGATLSSSTTPPTSAFTSSNDDDVWYEFTATQTSHYVRLCNVTFPVGSAVQMGIVLNPGCTATTEITGTPSGSLVTLVSGAGQMFFNNLTVGTLYKVRVLTSASASRANFNISVLGPQPQTYVSSTSAQPSTTSVAAGTTNAQVLRVEVVTTGTGSPMTLTQLALSTNGTLNTAAITAARVYYTGTSTTFATTTQFGTAVANPSGGFTVTGNQTLAGGATNTTNYFFVVYDVACNAATTDSLDAEVTSLLIGGLTYTPTVTAPAGKRGIAAPAVTRTSTIPTNAQAGTNVSVLYVQVPGSVACSTNVTALDISMSGTAVPADVTNVQVYYTTSSTLNTNTPFGSPVTFTSGSTATITGNQPLVDGTGNYFFLVYTLSSGATVGNTVSGNITAVTRSTSATPIAVTGTAPGNATITAALAGDAICSAPTVVLGTSATTTTNTYAISGRTLELGEPSPIINSQGSGAGQSNYSWGTASSGSYWYKLTVPTTGYGSSGNLFIWANTTGTVTDAQLAVWSFPNMPANCTNGPNFSGAQLLAANDDEIVTAQSANTLLNSAVRVNLIPGNTYYIELDGFSTNLPTGNLYVEDLAQAPYSISNNGVGGYYNPTALDSSFAAYEVNGADGWTTYYNNGGTQTVLTDDSVVMAINWGTGYLFGGTYNSATTMANHLRREPRTNSAPPTNGTTGTSGNNITVWAGRGASAVSANMKTTAPYVTNANAPRWYMMTKYWSVVPTNQPSTGTPVRTYYSTADFNALQTAITNDGGTLNGPSEMRFLKFTKSATTHYTIAELNPANTGHSTITAASASDLVWTNTNVSSAANQSQFTVTTFSGGGGGSTGIQGVTPLPISLSAISARAIGKTNRVDWTSASEENAAAFVIERSADGSTFQAIGKVAAQGKSAAYTFTDETPAAGISYYRLQMVDLNGESNYSRTVTATQGRSNTVAMSAYPNPATDRLTVEVAGATEGSTITLKDLSGKTLAQQTLVGNSAVFSVANLPAGLYFAVYTGGNATQVIKITKQ